MRKMLLISTALMFATLATARADEPSCQDFSNNNTTDKWCVDHGYKESSCGEGYTAINCPFNTTGKKFCHKNQVKDCAVGDILWNDNKCYVLLNGNVTLDESGMLSENGNDTVSGVIMNAPENKYPIGVVFDDVNKLAVGLNSNGIGIWQSTKDTSNDNRLQYFGANSMMMASQTSNNNNFQQPPKHLFFGYQTREADTYFSCTDTSSYSDVASYCSVNCPTTTDPNSNDYDTAESDSDGTKYLSCDNNSGQRCPRTKGCNIVGMIVPNGGAVTTMNVNTTGGNLGGATISIGTLPYNYVSSSSQTGGWHDTVKLRAGTLIEKGFNAPAAMTCYNLNTNFSSCPAGHNCMNDTGGAVGAGHVWFLPSVGDLIKLANNYEAVRKSLDMQYIMHINSGASSDFIDDVGESVMLPNSNYWSSSQAFSGGFYSYAYAVKRVEGTVSGTSCSAPRPSSHADTPVKYERTKSGRIVCVYHYGDDWDMSTYSSLWTTQTQQQEQQQNNSGTYIGATTGIGTGTTAGTGTGTTTGTGIMTGNRPPVIPGMFGK